MGASLFIGNLDPDIDEKFLYDTFGAFGVIVQTPKVFFLKNNKIVFFIFINNSFLILNI